MRLTRYTDYAFRTLFYLAINRGKRVRVADIAEKYAISQSHLVKVVQELTRRGYVTGRRGRGGGLTLVTDPDAINIGAIVRWSEPDLKIMDCEGCPIIASCNLPRPLHQALAAFLAVLDRYTLQDVLASSDGLEGLLGAA